MNYEPGTYFQVPNRQLLRGLPAITRSVYVALCDMSDSEGVCWPSHKKLGDYAGCGVTAIKTALNELEGIGLIAVRNRVSEDGGKSSNAYQLLIASHSPHATTPIVAERLVTITNINNNHLDTTNVVSTSEEKVAKPRKDNTDITQVITQFQEEFGLKLKQLREQRIHAYNLVRRYGLEKTLEGVRAAGLVRQERYAPMITDLKDLWFKWEKLEAFYHRKQKEQSEGVAVIT